MVFESMAIIERLCLAMKHCVTVRNISVTKKYHYFKFTMKYGIKCNNFHRSCYYFIIFSVTVFFYYWKLIGIAARKLQKLETVFTTLFCNHGVNEIKIINNKVWEEVRRFSVNFFKKNSATILQHIILLHLYLPYLQNMHQRH